MSFIWLLFPCYDGGEICELVGIYILTKVSNIKDKHSIDLCRDDGLGMIEIISGPQIVQREKKIIKRVTSNITSVDFLDITFNLKTESY